MKKPRSKTSVPTPQLDIAAYVRKSTQASGVPVLVTDPQALVHAARLVSVAKPRNAA